MIKGTTKSGFHYSIDDDNYELIEYMAINSDVLEALNAGTMSDSEAMVEFVPLMRMMIGENGYSALKRHCRKKNGNVSARRMIEEMAEILNSDGETKN